MIYYVSSSLGNDNWSGLTEETPFKTLGKITNMSLKKGDKVLLKCDDVWNETLTINIEDDFLNDKILVSSYGVGNKPTISSMKIHKSSLGLFENVGDNVYKINLNSELLSGYNEEGANVGFILDISTKKKYYSRVQTLDNLTEDMDFYCDDSYLYLKSTLNPNDRFNELGFAVKATLLTGWNNLHIDGLKFENTGGHGIAWFKKNCIIENCEISNCGGSVLFYDTFTRYGNGIELSTSENIVIRNNIISNCYDVGFTIQGTNLVSKNVLVENNKFLYNSQSLEIWTLGDSTKDKGIINFKFKNNICIGSGRGWGSKARPDKDHNCELLFYGLTLKNLEVNILDNIFINPKTLYYVDRNIEGGTSVNKFIHCIKSYKNKVYMSHNSNLINNENYSVNNLAGFSDNYKKDENTIFNAITNENDIKNVLSKINLGSNLSVDMILNNDTRNGYYSFNNIYNTVNFPSTEIETDKFFKFMEIDIDKEYSFANFDILYSLSVDNGYVDDVGILKVTVSSKNSYDSCSVDIYIPNKTTNISHKAFVGEIVKDENKSKICIYYNVAIKKYSNMSIKVLNLNYNKIKNIVIGLDNKHLSNIGNCIFTRFKNSFNETTNSYTNNLNKFTKICDINISKEYQSSVISLNYDDLDHNNIISGQLKVKFKVNDLSSNAYAKLTLINSVGDNITNNNFVGVITEDNLTNKRLEVYYKPTYSYSRLLFNSNHCDNYNYKNIKLYSNNEYIDTLPNGSVVDCTIL